MKPSSERRKRYNAALHQKRKYLSVHLSKELRATNKKRSMLVRKGDKVRVLRGSSKKQEATVARVDHKNCKVYLEGISKRSARGREMVTAFEPSNLLLISLTKRGAAPTIKDAKPKEKTENKKAEVKKEEKKVEKKAEKKAAPKETKTTKKVK